MEEMSGREESELVGVCEEGFEVVGRKGGGEARAKVTLSRRGVVGGVVRRGSLVFFDDCAGACLRAVDAHAVAHAPMLATTRDKSFVGEFVASFTGFAVLPRAFW